MTIKFPETPIQIDLKVDKNTVVCSCIIKEIAWSRDEQFLNIYVTAVKNYEIDDYDAIEYVPMISWALKYPKGIYASWQEEIQEYPIGEEFSFTITEEIYDEWDFEFDIVTPNLFQP